MLHLVVSALLAAPFSVAVAPLTGGSKELPTTELDTLITQALERAKAGDKVALSAPATADVLVQPTLEKLTTGKVRVTWLLVLRGSAQKDKVAFDFARPTFGPSGTQAMVDGMLARALKLKQGGGGAVGSASTTSSGGRQAFDIDEVNRTSAEQGETSSDLGIKESSRPPSQGFRIGISGGVGLFIPGPLIGPQAELRPGYQINDLMGVYASVSALGTVNVGGALGPTTVGLSVGAAAWYGVGAVFELILDHMFFFAAGLHVLNHGWATVGQSASSSGGVSSESIVSGGVVPGLSAKFGLGLGQPNAETGRRHQFSLSLDVMTIFSPSAVTVRQGVSGTDVMQGVNVTGLRVGLAPMLSLGWDFR